MYVPHPTRRYIGFQLRSQFGECGAHRVHRRCREEPAGIVARRVARSRGAGAVEAGRRPVGRGRGRSAAYPGGSAVRAARRDHRRGRAGNRGVAGLPGLDQSRLGPGGQFDQPESRLLGRDQPRGDGRRSASPQTRCVKHLYRRRARRVERGRLPRGQAEYAGAAQDQRNIHRQILEFV